MNDLQPSGHLGHRRRQDRPKALTEADGLNDRTLALGHAIETTDDKTRTDIERRYYGSIKSEQAASGLSDIAVGRATYSFTKGDAGVPHVFTAEVTQNGRIKNEKIYSMVDSRHMVEAKLGPNVTAQFEQFALADVGNVRKTSIEPYVQIQGDVSQANNYHRAKLLNDASVKDLMQQRMPKKPQDPSSGLGGLY